MFFNFFPETYHYLQYYAFSHREELKIGITVSQMPIEARRLLELIKETIEIMIEKH